MELGGGDIGASHPGAYEGADGPDGPCPRGVPESGDWKVIGAPESAAANSAID